MRGHLFILDHKYPDLHFKGKRREVLLYPTGDPKIDIAEKLISWDQNFQLQGPLARKFHTHQADLYRFYYSDGLARGVCTIGITQSLVIISLIYVSLQFVLNNT